MPRADGAPQRPVLTPEQVTEVIKAEAPHAVGSQLARVPSIRRERVMPGETQAQAKARWGREREIERDRERDPRVPVSGGRVMPVFYE